MKRIMIPMSPLQTQKRRQNAIKKRHTANFYHQVVFQIWSFNNDMMIMETNSHEKDQVNSYNTDNTDKIRKLEK